MRNHNNREFKMKKQFIVPAGVRYAHFRNITLIGKGPDAEKLIESTGGMTLAYTEDVDADGGAVVYVAAAFCHDKDNFSKEQGRLKSTALLLNLAAHKGQLDEETIVGQRYFTLAGVMEEVMPGFLAEVAFNSGLEQIRKPRTKKVAEAA